LFCERLASRLEARQAEEPQPAVAVLDIEHLPVTVKSGLACRGSSLDAEALVQNAEAGLQPVHVAVNCSPPGADRNRTAPPRVIIKL
jgi:hypothetical protein